MRPQWDGSKVSELQEALALSATLPSITLSLFALIALWRRYIWLSSLLLVGWLAWSFHILSIELFHDPYFTAQEVGCIGTSTTYLMIGFIVCICVLTITIFLKRS